MINEDMHALHEYLKVHTVQLTCNYSDDLFHLRMVYVEQERPLLALLRMLEYCGMSVFHQEDTSISYQDHMYTHRLLEGKWPKAIPEIDIVPALELLCAQWLAGDYTPDPFLALLWYVEGDLKWIRVLRAFAMYAVQLNREWAIEEVNEAVLSSPYIMAQSLRLFISRHSKHESSFDAAWDSIYEHIQHTMGGHVSRILLCIMTTMQSVVRTNAIKCSLSDPLMFKLDASRIVCMPEPCPWVEVFVYHETFEGVHLRMAPMSRGGLRWSDRLTDYRTEVLALVSAQQVKNAIIVPAGSKGGFVIKRAGQLALHATDEEVESAYKMFVRSLLYSVDNIDGTPLMPDLSVRYDEKDTYLVVAADKGTATFSDRANAESIACGYWLQDAFASGGTHGFDHKALGITAKGAWVTLKWFMRMLNMDNTITRWVGIGDMSGDVFGNGLLQSDAIQLIAAFDHRHIWIDPTPDPVKSFKERWRLFHLERSSWVDYDMTKASRGAAVYPRTVQEIILSDEAMEALGTSKRVMSPDALIAIILSAPVDVLWNGGIGTYIKAEHESEEDVKDPVNAGCRVLGSKVRARCIIEGGNVGITVAGRREYAQHGGYINTDFLDNSAGVDCSDHEVNIKILLSRCTLEDGERDALLQQATPEIERLVLMHNNDHNLVLLAMLCGVHKHFTWSHADVLGLKKLWPMHDYIPHALQLRPDACWLLALINMTLRDALVRDKYFNRINDVLLMGAFPLSILKKIPSGVLEHHPLMRPIMLSQWAHRMITDMGPLMLMAIKNVWGFSWGEIAQGYEEVYAWAHVLEYHVGVDEYLSTLETHDLSMAWYYQQVIWSVYVYWAMKTRQTVRIRMAHHRYNAEDIIRTSEDIVMQWSDMLGVGKEIMQGIKKLFTHKFRNLKDYAMRLEIAYTILEYAAEHGADKKWLSAVEVVCEKYPHLDACDIYKFTKNAT